MSLASVRAHLAAAAPDLAVIVTEARSATVEEAAAAHGVAPGQIAKTLALRIGTGDGARVVLVVAGGTMRLDNRKARALFGAKVSMLGALEVEALTGHPVGGVSPFGLATPLPVYCDVSLKGFDEVVPAAGSTHSAVRVAPSRLAEIAGAEWVDLCQAPGEAAAG
ncbi:MAG TPA: YbaK/EbsC family protein [Microvirga sp.]|jgi:prolyl-tRNA editing enzyme YbaK/EbsC (Cys-tRNA(Pro) deacylase)|nr:YbaK/EbsC family protein [Microvirga sp.]